MILSKGKIVADYSEFPFGMYSTEEIAQMFTDSVRVSDEEFAEACRERLKHSQGWPCPKCRGGSRA